KQGKRQRWYPKVEVLFGEPFLLDRERPDGTRYRSEELTDAMMLELARIIPASMRGIYAGRDLTSNPAVRRENLTFPER
ncbi:MAG: hypothetical protein ACOC9Y_02975, partial [Chloroflexota bacterium]